MKLLPQEIEIWYLIPAIRRELTKSLVSDFKLNQKQISECLGITEGAVSQYLNSKRAKELKFSKNELNEIKKTARKMISDKGKSAEYFYKLCIKLRGTGSVCKLHRKHDKIVPKNCDWCAK